jgi:hypothetical protein
MENSLRNTTLLYSEFHLMRMDDFHLNKVYFDSKSVLKVGVFFVEVSIVNKSNRYSTIHLGNSEY